MKNTFTILFACALSYNTNAQTILTGGFGSDGMGVLNGTAYTKTGTLGSGGYPFVSVSKDGTKFFATAPANNKFYFINASATTIVDSMGIYLRNSTAFNEPDILFGITNGALCRINTATKTFVDSISLGAPFQLAERPGAKEVWVSDSGRIHIVDYTSSLSATTMELTSSPYDNGIVQFTPGGTMAYKGASNSKKLYKINPATKMVVDSANTPVGVGALVVSHDSSKLFTCDPSNIQLKIYSTADLSLIDSIDCGTREPMNVYRHPFRNEIWAVNHFKDSVSVYNENTKALIAAFNCSGSPWYIAFSAVTTDIKNNYKPEARIIAYPNPTSSIVNLSGIDKQYTLKVLDAFGRSYITSAVNSGHTSFDIHDLASGLYYVQLIDEDGITRADIPVIKN